MEAETLEGMRSLQLRIRGAYTRKWNLALLKQL